MRDGGLIAQADFGVGQRPALGDQDLALDDVVAGDLLGDGVLDLDARIDLDEVELAAVGVDEELDGAGVVQADGPADGEGGVEDALAQGGIEIGGGGDLDDLLMAPLHGAIALEEVDQVAVLVAEQLHLDVAGAADELFEEDVGDAEGGAGLAAGLVEGVVELVRRQGDAHAAAAAAHRRLDDDRDSRAAGPARGPRRSMRTAASLPARTGTPAFWAMWRAVTLSPSCSRISVARPDEDDARPRGQARAKCGVFGEETVAGMDRVDVVFAGPGRRCRECRGRSGSVRRACRRGRPRRP